MKIALDAMGGDYAPEHNIVDGAVLALSEYPRIAKLILTGDTPRIEAELKRTGCNDARIEIVHTTQVVEMTTAASMPCGERKIRRSAARSIW